MAKKWKSHNTLLYVTVFLVTFLAALCIGYFAVTLNADAIGNFIQRRSESSSAESAENSVEEETDSEESVSSASSTSFSSENAGESVILAQTGEVDAEYFNRTVFIGDSLTVEVKKSSGFPDSPRILAASGMTPASAFTDPQFEEADGKKISLIDSLKYYNPRKVYVMLGINGLTGGKEPDEVLGDFKHLLDQLHQQYPDVTVVIQSVLPVAPSYDKRFGGTINEEVRKYNEGLRDFCSAESQVYFLDLTGDFATSDGALKSAYTTDGIHLNDAGNAVWVQALQTHGVSEKK